MFRLYRLTILIIFLIWIFPLGAFIAPAKEQKLCGGQRAICLCTHLLKKKPNASGFRFVSVSIQKDNAPSSSVNYLFLKLTKMNLSNILSCRHVEILQTSDYPTFISSVEHVPKT